MTKDPGICMYMHDGYKSQPQNWKSGQFTADKS